MCFLDYLYIILAFMFLTAVYMIYNVRQIDLERRISLGKLQMNKILAINGRRLSQFGLLIEKKFSDKNGDESKREMAKEDCTQRAPNNKERQIRPGNLNVKQTDAKETARISTIKHVDYKQMQDNTTIENEHSKYVKIEENKISTPSQQEMLNNTLVQKAGVLSHTLMSTNTKPAQSVPKVQECTRRDSIMPAFSTSKSLPRRKSVMPVLSEEPSTSRRASVIQPPLSLLGRTRQPSETVLVKPPTYVCPRRSSVLFSSALFAHTPERTVSKIGHYEKEELEGNSTAKMSCSEQSHPPEDLDKTSQSCKPRLWQRDPGRSRRVSSSGTVYTYRRRSVAVGFKTVAESETREHQDNPETTSSCSKTWSTSERKRSIPRLKGNYLTGNLSEFKMAFGPNAHEELMTKAFRHGPLYQISALGQKIVFLFDHKDIDALKKAEGRYPKHMDFKHLRIYRQRNKLPLGVLLSSGDEWKRQRKVLSKAMNSSVVQAQYLPILNKIARRAVEAIDNNLTRDREADSFLPEQDVNNFAIEAFGQVLYGRELNCLSSEKETDLHKFVKITKSNFEDAKALMTLPSCLMLLHPAWRRHNEKWNFLLETTIKQTLLSLNCEKRTPCVLSQLINSGEMSESEMLVNLTDLLHASIDTTSTAILWCLYELARDQNSVVKIVDEYKRNVGESEELQIEHLQRMTYLKAAIKETLRLHPVGFLASRIISKPMSVREYVVQPAANVSTCMYVMGRNKDLVQNPGRFEPERWLKDKKDLDRFYNDVPFGFGARMCLGKRIAEMEIALFLLYFCLKFEFDLSPTCYVDHTVKLLLVPSRPVELRIKKRGDKDL